MELSSAVASAFGNNTSVFINKSPPPTDEEIVKELALREKQDRLQALERNYFLSKMFPNCHTAKDVFAELSDQKYDPTNDEPAPVSIAGFG
jgi:hypothetical protein